MNAIMPCSERLRETLGRRVVMRKLLLLIVLSAWVLVASSPATLAKKATIAARANTDVTQRAHVSYARHWKRGYRAMSRRQIRPQVHARVYRRAPRAWASEWDDLTIQCLLSQPFVICP